MNDWIDKLKQETESNAHLEKLKNEHQEQAHSLIQGKAPELWNGFTTLVEQEVKKLHDTFPEQDAMNLTFQWDLADKIIVNRPSSRTGFTAQWNAGSEVIELAFIEQLLGMEGIPSGHDQINFVVSPQGEVLIVYGEATGADKIAEVLLKKLLTHENPLQQ